MHESSRRAIIAAFLANLGIAAAKIVAFAITGAASLLAEAIHSVADTGNQGLLFLGGRRGSQKAPTAQHPFGFGRERYFWSFVVALVLFSLGSVFALVEGVDKLIHPHTSRGSGSGVRGARRRRSCSRRCRSAPRSARRAPVRGDRSWWAFIRESKSPEIPVVLLEDFGALIGLAFALIGVTLATITDEGAFDAMGSIAIGLLLGVDRDPSSRSRRRACSSAKPRSPEEQQTIRSDDRRPARRSRG